jgi:hypothetical protein
MAILLKTKCLVPEGLKLKSPASSKKRYVHAMAVRILERGIQHSSLGGYFGCKTACYIGMLQNTKLLINHVFLCRKHYS